jgi:hypothetical protein
MPSHTRLRGLVGVSTIVAGLLLATPRAWADPRTDARAKLVQGGEMLKRGQFEDALARFQEAYKLVPSPKIQYNFGLAYRGLGRKADALEAFERFLAEAKDAPPDTRQTAERGRAQLLGQVTVLEVKTDLPDAEVFIDGRSYGTARASGIYLDPGPHQLSVEKPGQGTAYTERINATAGQRITVMARLVRGPNTEPPPPREPPPREPSPHVEPLPPSGGHDVPPPAAAELRWQPIAGWAAAAGAVGAAAFGTYQLVVSNSKFSEFNNYHGEECGETKLMRGSAHCNDLYQEASSARTRELIGYVAAGALAATATLLFVITPEKPAAGSVSLACAPSLVNPGVSCAARF